MKKRDCKQKYDFHYWAFIMALFLIASVTCICRASESDYEYSWRLGREAQESYNRGDYTEALLLAQEAANVPDESVSAAAVYALQKVTDSYVAPMTEFSRGGKNPLTNLFPIGDFKTESAILDYWVDESEDILITIESTGTILCRNLFTHEVTNTFSIKLGDYIGDIQHYNLTDGAVVVVSRYEIVCFNCNGGEQIWDARPFESYASFSTSTYDTESNIFYVLEDSVDAHLVMFDAETGEILDRRRLVYDINSSVSSFPKDFSEMILSEDKKSILFISYPTGTISETSIVLTYSLSDGTCKEVRSVEGNRRACAVDKHGRLITVSEIADTTFKFSNVARMQLGAKGSIVVTSQEPDDGDVLWQREVEFALGDEVCCKTIEYYDASEKREDGILIAAGNTTCLIDCQTGEMLSKLIWSTCVVGIEGQEDGFYVFLEDGTYECTFYSWLFAEDNAEVYVNGISDPLFDTSVSSAGYLFKDRHYYLACSEDMKKVVIKCGSVADPSFKILSPDSSSEEKTFYSDIHMVLDDKLVCLKGNSSGYELTDLEVYDAKEGLLFTSNVKGFDSSIKYLATDKNGRHIFKGDYKIGILDIEGKKFTHFDINKDTYDHFCDSPGFYWTLDEDTITAETWETGVTKQYTIDGLSNLLGTDYMNFISVSDGSEYALVSTSPYEPDDVKFSIAIVDLSTEKASLIQTGKELIPWDKGCIYSDGLVLAATKESVGLYDKNGVEVLDLGLVPNSVASVCRRDGDLWFLLCDGTIQKTALSESYAITTYFLYGEFYEYENCSWQFEDSLIYLTSDDGLYVLDTKQGEQKLFIPGGAGYSTEFKSYYVLSNGQRFSTTVESDMAGVFPAFTIRELKEKAEKRSLDLSLTERQKSYYHIRESAAPEEIIESRDAENKKKEKGKKENKEEIIQIEEETHVGKINQDEKSVASSSSDALSNGEILSTLQPTYPDLRTLPKQNTLMIYMVGSNLESRFAAATKDLREMRASGVDFSKTNVIVFTGGSKRWNCNVKVDSNCVLDISLSEDKWIVAQSEETLDMGEPGTLSAFVNYCAQYYPAEHFSLICWDHGGGSLLGYGSDELFKGDSLLLPEMQQAMQQTPFDRDNPLDIIGFDACLMGNLETAVIWSDFASYMVGSEELEAGDGWDYHFLNIFNDTADPQKVAAGILKETGAFYEIDTPDRSGADVTLSCLDLSATQEVCDALDELSSEMSKRFSPTMYANVRKATSNVRRFGSSALSVKADDGTQMMNSGYDQLDLLQYSRDLQELYPESANKLARAVRKLVVNQISTIDRTGGISFYFPGDNQELYRNMGKQETATRSFGEGYINLLSEIEDYWQNYKAVSSDLGEIVDEGEELTLKLPEDLKEHITETQVFLLWNNDYTHTAYYPCLRFNAVPDESGYIRLPKDIQVFGLKQRDGESTAPWRFIQKEMNGESKEYVSELTSLLAHCWSFDGEIKTDVQVKISSTENDDTVYVKDIVEIDDEGNSSRNSVDVTPWQGISILYVGYREPDEGETGFTPWYNWDKHGYLGNQIPLTGDISFEKKKLSDYDLNFCIQIVATTDYGADYASNMVQIHRRKKEKTDEKTFSTEQGSLIYRIENDHVNITGYKGKDSRISLPNEIEGLPVTVIGKRAFALNKTLEEIVFPETLVSLKASAFSDCDVLRKVIMNPRLKEIDSQAFYACKNLKEVCFPDSPEFLGKKVFFECEALETIRTVSEAEKTKIFVSGNAIYDNYGKTLSYYASGKKDPLVVKEGTETIGAAACWEAAVREVVLPETVKTIENGAFCGCELDTLELPESLEYIGIEAFGTPYGDDVFESTGTLSSVRLGKNVSFIGERAFDYLRLKEFFVDEENTVFSSLGGFLASKNGDVLLSVPSMSQWSVTIPEGVTRIAKSACTQSEEVLNFHIPDSVIVIEDDAFNKDYSYTRGYYYPFTIYGKEGSYAEEFAKENHIKFIAE